MRPRILWDRISNPSAEGHTSVDYGATYYDAEGVPIVAAQGSSLEEAVTNLHAHLEQLGYDRSSLPRPEPQRTPRR